MLNFSTNLVVNTSEVNYAAGVAAYTFGASRSLRITMQAVWTGYTGGAVKLQASLDGTNYADVASMSIDTSGNLVSGDVGPFEYMRIHVTGTLSAGADTMKVWIKESVKGY
jgi:hypothetical protein